MNCRIKLSNTLTASLQRGKTPPHPKRMSCYDFKQPHGEAPVMLELWGMRSCLSLLLLTSSHRFSVVTNDRILSTGQI